MDLCRVRGMPSSGVSMAEEVGGPGKTDTEERMCMFRARTGMPPTCDGQWPDQAPHNISVDTEGSSLNLGEPGKSALRRRGSILEMGVLS